MPYPERISDPLDSGHGEVDRLRGNIESDDLQTAREPGTSATSLANLTPAYHGGDDFAGELDWWAKQLGRT
jgi:hypothetical protein